MNYQRIFYKLPDVSKIFALAVSLFILFFSTVQVLGQSSTEEFVSLDSSTFIEEMDDSEFTETLDVKEEASSASRYLIWVYYLSFTILATVLVRFRKARYTRHFMLLASLIFFGFFTGGCPCVISAFQNLVLFLLGVDVRWESLVFFAAIIVFTYLFGRVWCGWVCHLGALQEFIYSTHIKKIPLFKSEKTQKTLRKIRIVLFVALIVQLVITEENLFIHIDPFKVAFNLSSYYVTGWILLAILLVSSLYIYRPFCQAVCPIGLVMTWVSKIPGASMLSVGNQCNGCSKCSNVCLLQAIQVDKLGHRAIIDNGECIVCGSCMDDCRNQSICFDRKPIRSIPVEIPTGLKN